VTQPLQVDTQLLETDLQLTMAYFVLLLVSWWDIKELCPGLTSDYPFGIFKLFEHQQFDGSRKLWEDTKGVTRSQVRIKFFYFSFLLSVSVIHFIIMTEYHWFLRFLNYFSFKWRSCLFICG